MGDRTPDHEGLAREIRALKERVADHEERLRNMAGEMDGEIARRKRLEDRVERIDGQTDEVARDLDERLTDLARIVHAMRRGDPDPDLPDDPTPSSGEGEPEMPEAVLAAANKLTRCGLSAHADSMLSAVRRLVEELREERARADNERAAANDAVKSYNLAVEENDRLRREVDNYQILRRAVNEAGDCLPGCSSYGHEDECPTAHNDQRMIEMQREIERLRSGGRIELTAGAVEVVATWLNKRESRFAWEDLTKESKEHYERQAELLLDDSVPYLSIQPPEDEGGEPSEDTGPCVYCRRPTGIHEDDAAELHTGVWTCSRECWRRAARMYDGDGDPEAAPPSEDAPDLVSNDDVDEDLLQRIQEAEVTDRHLRALCDGKQAARDRGLTAWTQRLTMVEAIILWWEQCVRDEVVGVAKQEAARPEPTEDALDSEGDLTVAYMAGLERGRDLGPRQPTEAPEGEDPLEVTEDDAVEALDRFDGDAVNATEAMAEVLRWWSDRLRTHIERHYRPREVSREDYDDLLKHPDTDPGITRFHLTTLGLHLPGEEGR